MFPSSLPYEPRLGPGGAQLGMLLGLCVFVCFPVCKVKYHFWLTHINLVEYKYDVVKTFPPLASFALDTCLVVMITHVLMNSWVQECG